MTSVVVKWKLMALFLSFVCAALGVVMMMDEEGFLSRFEYGSAVVIVAGVNLAVTFLKLGVK